MRQSTSHGRRDPAKWHVWRDGGTAGQSDQGDVTHAPTHPRAQSKLTMLDELRLEMAAQAEQKAKKAEREKGKKQRAMERKMRACTGEGGGMREGGERRARAREGGVGGWHSRSQPAGPT